MYYIMYKGYSVMILFFHPYIAQKRYPPIISIIKIITLQEYHAWEVQFKMYEQAIDVVIFYNGSNSDGS